MVFLSDGFIGDLIGALTANVTGSVFLTLLLITFLVMAFAFVFRIPVEFTALLIFPLLIGFGAYSGAYMAVLGVAIIYVAALIMKNFFFWK